MSNKFDFSLALLSLYCIRPALLGASIADSLIIAALVGMHVYRKWVVAQQQKPIDEDVKAELKDLKTAVTTLSMGRTVNRF